jgi:hypothetical protein
MSLPSGMGASGAQKDIPRSSRLYLSCFTSLFLDLGPLGSDWPRVGHNGAPEAAPVAREMQHHNRPRKDVHFWSQMYTQLH